MKVINKERYSYLARGVGVSIAHEYIVPLPVASANKQIRVFVGADSVIRNTDTGDIKGVSGYSFTAVSGKASPTSPVMANDVMRETKHYHLGKTSGGAALNIIQDTPVREDFYNTFNDSGLLLGIENKIFIYSTNYLQTDMIAGFYVSLELIIVELTLDEAFSVIQLGY